MLKRASVALNLRLPRGRPPAVGIDSSFFNLTPPSAEAVTPTKEIRPVVNETVETSATIKAPRKPSVPTAATDIVTIDGEKTITAMPNNVDSPKPLLFEAGKPVTNGIERPLSTDVTQPASSNTEKQVSIDTEKPVSTITEKPESAEDRLSGETIIPVKVDGEKADEIDSDTIKLPTGEQLDRFVLAAPPDVNPNPHS